MSRWGIKSPSGKLVTSSSREIRGDCIDDYILSMVRLEFIKERREWWGPDYTKKMWAVLRKDGYKCVKVAIEMHNDGKSYQWPELVELPKQEDLFAETLIRRKYLHD